MLKTELKEDESSRVSHQKMRWIIIATCLLLVLLVPGDTLTDGIAPNTNRVPLDPEKSDDMEFGSESTHNNALHISDVKRIPGE